jgi:hypothetical protein
MAARTMIHPPNSSKKPVSFMKNLVHYSNRAPSSAAGVCVNVFMADAAEQPFHSIESAHEFMVVLENVIVDAQGELRTMLDDANNASDERRTEALRLALFKISQLETHTRKSRRILNDLGLIRSLLVRGQ